MTAAQSDTHAFLGEEFLTWLWFKVDSAGGQFTLPGGVALGVVLDDFLAFAPREGDETEQTLKKGLPTRSAEAAAALRNGCRLRRAKLILGEGPAQWSLVVDGPTLNLLSVRLPEDSEEVTEPKEISCERAMHFARAFELVSGLYRLFLEERLRPEYLKSTAEAQANWMQMH